MITQAKCNLNHETVVEKVEEVQGKGREKQRLLTSAVEED